MTQTRLQQVNSNRYQQGWQKLAQVDGRAGEQVIESLKVRWEIEKKNMYIV